MQFIDFFPIYRDSIIGLTFMHINRIAHRDIKPANIMMMTKNKFALADYGIGINLSTREEYSERGKDFF